MTKRTITIDIDNSIGNRLFQLLQAMKDAFPLLNMEIKGTESDSTSGDLTGTP